MFDEEAEAKLRALHRQLQKLEEKRKEIIGQIERLGLGTGAKALNVAEAAAPANACMMSCSSISEALELAVKDPRRLWPRPDRH